MLMIARPVRRLRTARANGIALITAVIMLLVITLLALGGARIALDTKRSTRNQRDFEIAYQAAEAALYDAEIDIQNSSATLSRSSYFAPNKADGFLAGGCNSGTTAPTPFLGLCDTFGGTGDPIWNSIDWTASAGNRTVEYGTFTGRTFPTGSGLTPGRKPRYLIELVPDNTNGASASSDTAKRYMYRITAVGFGPNDTTRALVQSIYRKSDS